MAQSVQDHGLHAVAISDAVEMASRRIARTWSLTAVALFVILGATVGIPHGPDLEPWEKLVQLATLALLATGILLAWRWEGLGGAIMLVGSAFFWGMAALQHQPLISFVPAVLFIVPAVAFLVAWNRTKTTASVVVLATAVTMIVFTGGALAQTVYDRGYGAAHPESSLPALADSPVVWIWSGAITETSATVVVRVADGGDVSLTVRGSDDSTAEFRSSPSGDVWRFDLAGLSPGTKYTYFTVVDGVAVDDRAGTFTTFPAGPTSFTVAAASCARLGSNGAVYEAIVAAEPDLFMATGDLFYADYVETAAHFTHAYGSSLSQPAQAHLYASVPIAYVWDDHDYGRNNSDRTSPTRSLALDAYAQNVPHYPLAQNDAVYQAFTIGRVQFVMLDDRSHRDPGADPDGPDKTMLGDQQVAWLQDRLLNPGTGTAMTVIVSQVPWVAAPEAGADHWGGYTYERQLIADFISTNGIDNVLMVAGDAHMVAIDDGSNTDYSAAGNASFPLLQAAALDRPGSVKGGPYSEGAFPGGGQFGLIAVTDTGGPTIGIQLSGIDWAGNTRVEYSYTVDVP